MVKIINGVLTSPVNAGSLERGDVIVYEGKLNTILDVVHDACPVIEDGQAAIEYRAQIKMQRSSGNAWRLSTLRNRPLDRVTGARSGGQIN